MANSKPRDEASVQIACIQMEPVVGRKDDNVRRGIEMIEEAAGNGANLVVLPELCNSGYVEVAAELSRWRQERADEPAEARLWPLRPNTEGGYRTAT